MSDTTFKNTNTTSRRGRKPLQNKSTPPSNDQIVKEISELAYQYYVQRGYREGHAQEDWIKAERKIKSKWGL